MFQPAKKTTLVPILLSAALGALAFSCTGCGEKEETSQAQPPRPQRPAQTARNDEPADDYDDYEDYDDDGGGAPGMALAMTLDDLRFEMSLDRRVSVNPQQSVDDRTMAEAALRFCEAYAKGDPQAFGRYLAAEDRATLEELTATGLWQAETASISEVALLELTPMGMGYLLKVGIDGSTLVTQDWTAQKDGEAFAFAARTGYVDYGASLSLEELKTMYFEGGGMSGGMGEAGGGLSVEGLQAALAELQAGSEDGESEEEAEPYERPSMNPAHHIRKKFYPGG
ncbi:MAG: hypothetical protein ACF8NJ_03920 [Phycisphaerales bacterium JB038]